MNLATHTCQGENLGPWCADNLGGKSRELTCLSESLEHHVGTVVRQLRTAQRMSQGKLAEKAGLHLNTVSRFERDPDAADSATLERLAEALGVKAATLLSLRDAGSLATVVAAMRGGDDHRFLMEQILGGQPLDVAPDTNAREPRQAQDDDEYSWLVKWRGLAPQGRKLAVRQVDLLLEEFAAAGARPPQKSARRKAAS